MRTLGGVLTVTILTGCVYALLSVSRTEVGMTFCTGIFLCVVSDVLSRERRR